MGNLRLIIGPMWSSKSTALLALHRKFQAIGKTVLLVNHASDTRYMEDGISTHDGVRVRCHMAGSMAEVLALPEYPEAKVVLINEGQFFPDLLAIIPRECDATDKSFVVAGLSGGYERQPVGDILKLIPHAETVEKLEGLCQDCKDGTPAPFTKRMKPAREGESLIGGAGTYKCVCRRHFLSDRSL